MKSISIVLLCSMKMLDERIMCINMLEDLFVSCLDSCVNSITTLRYESRSDPVCIRDWT